MSRNEIRIEKTGLVFFDMVKGFSHSEAMVTNGQLLARAARRAGIPVFFAKMNSRSDSATGSVLQTD